MDNELTLQKFISEEHERLSEFSKWYQGHHEQDPLTFPHKLNASEWHEQFMVWSETYS